MINKLALVVILILLVFQIDFEMIFQLGTNLLWMNHPLGLSDLIHLMQIGDRFNITMNRRQKSRLLFFCILSTFFIFHLLEDRARNVLNNW